MPALSAPFDGYRDVVRPEWIDHNDHLNVGYYGVVFDYATDEFLDHIGLDRAHRTPHAVPSELEHVADRIAAGVGHHDGGRAAGVAAPVPRLRDIAEHRIDVDVAGAVPAALDVGVLDENG